MLQLEEEARIMLEEEDSLELSISHEEEALMVAQLEEEARITLQQEMDEGSTDSIEMSLSVAQLEEQARAELQEQIDEDSPSTSSVPYGDTQVEAEDVPIPFDNDRDDTTEEGRRSLSQDSRLPKVAFNKGKRLRSARRNSRSPTTERQLRPRKSSRARSPSVSETRSRQSSKIRAAATSSKRTSGQVRSTGQRGAGQRTITDLLGRGTTSSKGASVQTPSDTSTDAPVES
jgi:hypothetical protein